MEKLLKSACEIISNIIIITIGAKFEFNHMMQIN